MVARATTSSPVVARGADVDAADVVVAEVDAGSVTDVEAGAVTDVDAGAVTEGKLVLTAVVWPGRVLNGREVAVIVGVAPLLIVVEIAALMIVVGVAAPRIVVAIVAVIAVPDAMAVAAGLGAAPLRLDRVGPDEPAVAVVVTLAEDPAGLETLLATRAVPLPVPAIVIVSACERITEPRWVARITTRYVPRTTELETLNFIWAVNAFGMVFDTIPEGNEPTL